MCEGNSNKIKLEIIVNGKSFGEMFFPEGIELIGLRSEALEKTKNIGQPPENWDVKDANGNILDLKKHLSEIAGISQLWLTLKAGIGGR